MSEKSTRAKIVGFVMIAAAIVTLLIAMPLDIAEFLAEPEPEAAPQANLQAQVTYLRQYHTPGVRQCLEGQFFIPKFTGCEFPDSLPYHPASYQLYDGVWKVSVTNEGDLVADSVVLFIPDVAYAIDSREGVQTFSETVGGGNIELGSLRPGRTTEVIAWAEFHMGGTYQADEIKISHRAGRGEVIFD